MTATQRSATRAGTAPAARSLTGTLGTTAIVMMVVAGPHRSPSSAEPHRWVSCSVTVSAFRPCTPSPDSFSFSSPWDCRQ